MRQLKYSCDGGSILVGNENFQLQVLNSVGDGEYNVYVFDSLAEYYHQSKIRGELRCTISADCMWLFKYDCITDSDICDPVNHLVELSGKHCIEIMGNGDIVVI